MFIWQVLLGKVPTREEIQSTIGIFKAINLEYLPLSLLFWCHFKGAMYKERVKEENTQLHIDELSEQEEVHDAKAAFEIFFGQFLEAFIEFASY